MDIARDLYDDKNRECNDLWLHDLGPSTTCQNIYTSPNTRLDSMEDF
jgi:hypothetical protein